jgi:hypothetical protein
LSGVETTRCPVLGAITISGIGVDAASVSAPESNQMKIAVLPALYDFDWRSPLGPARSVLSHVLASVRVPMMTSCCRFGMIQVTDQLGLPSASVGRRLGRSLR